MSAVTEDPTLTLNQGGDRQWRHLDLAFQQSMNPVSTFGSIFSAINHDWYQSMNLILKSTNDEFNNHLKLEDKLRGREIIPLCLLCSVLPRYQLRDLPLAGILSRRLCLLLLVVIFPLQVNIIRSGGRAKRGE